MGMARRRGPKGQSPSQNCRTGVWGGRHGTAPPLHAAAAPEPAPPQPLQHPCTKAARLTGGGRSEEGRGNFCVFLTRQQQQQRVKICFTTRETDLE
jgi:hypothetical protein